MVKTVKTARPRRTKKAAQHGFLAVGGEMGALIGAQDWAATSLGPIERWPQSLKSTIKTILGSRYPMILLWGDELLQFYNDAYIGLIGDKHPYALGRSIRKTQAESWEVIGPMIHEVMSTGEPNWVPAQMLPLNRSGYQEESYFSLSYSAVENDIGAIEGMLCVCSEVTQQVITERRLRLQRDLAAKAMETRSADLACRDIAKTIGEYSWDVPFALLYLREKDGTTLTLQASVGLEGDAFCPVVIDLADKEKTKGLWPFAKVAKGETVVIKNVERHIQLTSGPFNDTVTSALAMPIAAIGQAAPAGVFIAGVSPNRALDEGYSSFYELLAGQVSTAIRNAQAYAEERKRAEALAELDRAKTTFFSNVSHEFRTPLTLMLGPLEDALSDRQHALPKDQRERLQLIQRNSLRLQRLVNTLLDFSRIEAGRIQAHYQATDLCAYTAELACAFQSAMEKAGLTFTVDCKPLKQAVYVDHDMWEKIVLNLLSNALKFTFEGQVSVTLREKKGAVELQVSDTGTGIAEEELPNLFKRFHRVHGAKSRTHEGSGIGLALVQELVKLHGGTIQATSKLGKGTTFTVRIPTGAAHLPKNRVVTEKTNEERQTVVSTVLVDEAAQWLGDTDLQASDDTTGADIEKPQDDTQPARILVVDDNADMRAYVQRILAKNTNWQVATATNGVQALEAIKKHRPDLVLSDIMTPEMDGFELTRQLRADDKTKAIPIIFLSARAGEEAKVEGLGKGADDYLVKPFSARELTARVRTQLEMARIRQNMTELRQAEEALQQSEERLRALVIASSDAVYRMSPDWSEMRQLDGRNFLADTGKPDRKWLQKYIHPNDQKRVMAAIKEAIANKRIFELEHQVKQADSSLGWTFSRAVPILDHNGEIVEWFGAASDITKRKRVEEDLREARDESERQKRIYEAVTASTPDLIYVFDLNYRFTYANEALLTMWGRSWDESIGKGLLELGYEPWHAEMHEREIDQVVATKKPIRGEVSFPHAELGRRVYDYIFVPVLNDRGDVEAVAGTTRDVTEQGQARQRVEEQNRLLEMVASGAPLYDALEFLVSSVEKQSSAGMKASILLLDADKKHLRHGAAPSLPKAYNKAIDGIEIGASVGSCGTAAYTKEPVIVSDISTDPLWKEFKDLAHKHKLRSCWSTPIFSSDHQVLGTFALYYGEPRTPGPTDKHIIDFATRTATLIIERKQAEEALQESEMRFRQLAETLPQLVWTAGPDGAVEYFNQHWYDYTGTTPEQVLGDKWTAVLHPEDKAHTWAAWSEGLETGQPVSVEYRLRGRDGNYRWFLGRATPQRGPLGDITWYGTCTDIEELKRKHEVEQRMERLREQRNELIKLNKTKDEFIALASHQLRTPATAVKQYIGLLMEEYAGPVSADQIQYLQTAYDSNERQLRIINDLLKTAQLDATGYKLTKERHNMAGLVREVLADFSSIFELKRQKITYMCEDETITAEVDGMEMKLVLINLIENASKYTFPGKQIHVSLRQKKHQVEIAVSDEGVGISPENMKRIFEKFTRIDNDLSDTVTGTGLGLYWVKRIVKLHKGSITVDSVPKKGSTFTISLPL